MKIRIEYYYDPSTNCPFEAKTWLNGRCYVACGTSWEQVKSRLIDKLNKFRQTDIPQPEEIDL